MSQRRNKLIILIVLVLSAIYLATGFYFSGQIVNPKFKSLEEDQARLNLPSLKELGMPEPQTIEFSSDGITHRGWLFSGPRKDCGLVVHHGFTGTRWGALPYARHFSRCQVLVYDARGHGESDHAKCTYGAHEQKALLQAIALLREKTGLENRQIGLIGESMGAATMLLAAAQENGFAFLIADSPFATVEDIIRERAISLYGKGLLPLLPVARFFAEWRGAFNFDNVHPAQAVKQIKDPLLVVHSQSDVYTLPEHSRRIYDAIPGDRKDLFLTDWNATHARSMHTNPETYLRRLKSFVSRYAPDYPGLW